MRRIHSFILGLLEFRSCYTTHFSDYDCQIAYDTGRELAHKLTLRKWEQA